MKRNKEKAIEIMAWVLVFSFWIFGYIDTIDTSLPSGDDDPAEADDNMRRIQGGFQEILNVEHDASLTGTVITGDGTHKDITADSVTSAGAILGTTIAGTNITASGTLDVNGVATLGDGSLLKTSAAPTTDAMVANKKYVDDQLAFSVYTRFDSEANTLVKDNVYEAQTDGFVSAHAPLDNSELLKILVSTFDPPNEIITQNRVRDNDTEQGSQVAVAAGEFFQVTSGAQTPIIRWKSRGPLSEPVDQD